MVHTKQPDRDTQGPGADEDAIEVGTDDAAADDEVEDADDYETDDEPEEDDAIREAWGGL